MARSLPFVLVMSALALAVAGVLSALRLPEQGPVYSVSAVQTGLAHNAGAWVGHTVRVRGVAEACLASSDPPLFLSCNHWPPDLADPDPSRGSKPLPLTWGTQSPLLALLHRLPLVSGPAPPSAAPRWWTVAIYRVYLRVAPPDLCGVAPCYEAVWVDAAPNSQ
jgi:hypothetical protein